MGYLPVHVHYINLWFPIKSIGFIINISFVYHDFFMFLEMMHWLASVHANQTSEFKGEVGAEKLV